MIQLDDDGYIVSQSNQPKPSSNQFNRPNSSQFKDPKSSHTSSVSSSAGHTSSSSDWSASKGGGAKHEDDKEDFIQSEGLSKTTCGSCGIMGHNRNWSRCPNYFSQESTQRRQVSVSIQLNYTRREFAQIWFPKAKLRELRLVKGDQNYTNSSMVYLNCFIDQIAEQVRFMNWRKPSVCPASTICFKQLRLA